jgi:hypothetical protein
MAPFRCYYCGWHWFGVGEHHGSVYDDVCWWWDGQRMDKNLARNGTLAWIRTDGGWSASVTTAETSMRYWIDPYTWIKKLSGKNSSSVGYAANLYGVRDAAPGCI